MPNALACLIRSSLLAGLLLPFASTAPALEPSASWLANAWRTDNGLPDNSVTGVAQTPDGYLWAATAGGLMRFDGMKFQEFPLVNLEGVPNRVVRAMLLDLAGQLWLGMDRGPVVCIGPGSARVFRQGLPDARATGMTEDAEGAIWIAYANGGISRIKEGQVALFGSAEGVPAGGALSLASDARRQLWFAKGSRIGVFRDGKFRTLLTVSEPTASVGQARQGGVWICAGSRLLRFEEGSKPEECCRLPAGAETIDTRVLFEDRSGALWIGTGADGLFRWDGAKLELMPASYREITCLAEDREGNIWAGTGGGGLNRLRPRTMELLGADSGLPFESVRSVCEDPAGAIWVTTQNGLLARWQNAAWTVLSKETNWPGGHVSCVSADRQGAVWIGTHDRGLHRLQAGRFTHWRQTDGLGSDTVRSLLPDSRGDLWIATDSPSRLQRLHNGQLQRLEMPRRARSFRAMAEDAAGDIWVASAEGLLWRVSRDMVANETGSAAARPLSIRCLHATPDGALWIGYAGWGLGRLKDGRLARITTEQGLQDDYVSLMVADDRGWLWCVGNHGLFQVSLQELADAAEGRLARVRSIVYRGSEGLPNLQANYENFPGALRGCDGRLWFATRTGLAVVHPESIRHNPAPPPVVLERVTLDGQTLALYDSRSPLRAKNPAGLADLRTPGTALHLPPGDRKLEFEFAALSFAAPENVHIRYQLEGSGDDWAEAGPERKAVYRRLPAGNYRFRVAACINAGAWNADGPVLSFTVAPFFWQTWWFRLAAVTGFTLSIVAVVRYVSFRRLHRQLRLLEQQAALHHERARIAKDIHDDLGANLTQIALLGELARQDRGEPEKAAERVATISATARQAIKSLDEIVWAVNPRNDTLAHLIDYAGQFALDYLRLAGIRCRLDFPEQTPARELSTDLRHNLFLVVKEALNNVVKHARASEVWLRARVTEQALEMVVEDNGCGFERAPEDPHADGLRNMRQRLAEIGGQCRIESQPGAGTKVILNLPWPKGPTAG